MVIKLLRAWGAGITAFVNELSPFDFPLLGDYVGDDATEDGGYLMWPTDSSCDVAAGAGSEKKDPAGVDAPSAPAGLPELDEIDWRDLGEAAHSFAQGWPVGGEMWKRFRTLAEKSWHIAAVKEEQNA